MIIELIKEALVTLRTNLMRTILTMIGIILGVGAVVAIMTLGRSAYITAEKTIQDSGFGNIQIGHNYGSSSDSITSLDSSLIKLLDNAQIEDVISYEPRAYGYGDEARNGEDETIGVTMIYANEKEARELKYLQGGAFDTEDIEAKSQVAVVDPVLAKKLFGSPKEALGQSFRLRDGQSFKIVGIFEDKGSNFSFGNTIERGQIYLPLSMVEMQPWFQTYGYDYISVNTKTGADFDRVSQDLEDYLLETFGFEDRDEMTISIENVKDMMAEVNMFMTAFSIGLSLIAAISLVVGGVGIMNIMLVSVTERTKEIGLMKALGANDRDIIFQFLVESVVITICGGLIGAAGGIALSAGLIQLANTLGAGMLPEFTFMIDQNSIVVSLVVSLLIGLVFGIYPARRAAKLDPVEALRRD